MTVAVGVALAGLPRAGVSDSSPSGRGAGVAEGGVPGGSLVGEGRIAGAVAATVGTGTTADGTFVAVATG